MRRPPAVPPRRAEVEVGARWAVATERRREVTPSRLRGAERRLSRGATRSPAPEDVERGEALPRGVGGVQGLAPAVTNTRSECRVLLHFSARPCQVPQAGTRTPPPAAPVMGPRRRLRLSLLLATLEPGAGFRACRTFLASRRLTGTPGAVGGWWCSALRQRGFRRKGEGVGGTLSSFSAVGGLAGTCLRPAKDLVLPSRAAKLLIRDNNGSPGAVRGPLEA